MTWKTWERRRPRLRIRNETRDEGAHQIIFTGFAGKRASPALFITRRRGRLRSHVRLVTGEGYCHEYNFDEHKS